MEIVLAIVGKCVEPILHYTVEPIVGYTVAPILRQVGYLIFYKHNFKNLNDQVAELKRIKDTISHEVEVDRRNGRKIRDDAKNWLDRVDKIIEAAEKFGDDPGHSNAGCCKGPFPDLKSRHQLSRKAQKMAANVSEVMKGKDNFGQLTFLPHLEGVGATSATSSDKLESRRKMKEDIVLALSDPSVSRIGVYGLGGVGKTTLVKEIAKQVEDDKLFDEVVIANISQALDLERIQGEIADFLGLSFTETTIAGRAVRLRQRIKNDEKRILVILDDIWATLDLDKLGIPPDDHKGCKLLLTSRNERLLKDMETQKNFQMDVLNDAEAWSLFEDMVGDVVKDNSLREVAKQVAQKCAGLIVLIVTVAKALKNKDDFCSWKEALSQLNTVDEEGMTEKISSALQFSYKHLEGNDVKELFLLCGLVGPTSVEYLLKYGMGLGIFKHAYTPIDARLKLHGLIGSLKASCLLLESSMKCKTHGIVHDIVKMHDIVHDIAVLIASRDRHAFKIRMGDELKKWPPEEFLQRCTQIIIDCHIPKLPERLECPNIKLFCLYNENESLSVPDSFFEGMKNLKVLDLTSMHLTSLPQSFHSFIDLQTLCLDFCTLQDMTNIGALTNLQILSLKGSSMITFPSEIGQLTHLIMLDLTGSGIEIFPSNIISKLTKLEELYLGNTSIKWEQNDLNEENKNASLSELRHLTNLTALEIQIKEASVLLRDIMFDKLERYKIVVGDVWEWSDNYGATKMLKLKLGTVIHLEHWIKELVKGVEDLYLDDVNGISNVLYDSNGEGFTFLKHLHLQNNGNIQHIINSMERKPSHAFFPKLETLLLQNLNTLEKICDGSFVNNSFANLRSVKVQCCDQMKYLFSVLMVKALCQLVKIKVSECNSMKKIVSVENTSPNSQAVDDYIEFCSLQSLTLRYMPAMEDFYSGFLTSSTTKKQRLTSSTNVPSSFFNTKVKFSTLETLKLSSIHLENIWQEDHLCVANSFHKLADLRIEECNGLKYLFSSSMIGSFPNLKEVEVRKCEMMEQIIGPEEQNGPSIVEVGLPRLERVVISNMKRLKKVWHSQFDGLKTMEVNNCEKLENIFPFDMHTTFRRIETLKVSDCGSVKEIFQLPANEINNEENTQLMKLDLFRLPKLKQIWSKDPQGTFRFHNLQNVSVEGCVNLEYLFPFSIALDLSQLETLKVNSCGMNEIVGKKEGPMEEEAIFLFGRLYSLQIWSMFQLDRFYGGSHSLTCPSLRKLWISYCTKLKLLGRQSISNNGKNADDRNPYISMQKPLFIIEEVIPKLELWALKNEEATMVLQDPQWKDMYLSKLKTLRLADFTEDEVAATLLDTIVQKASNFKVLVVEHSSMKEIFRDERIAYKEGNNKINTQLELLTLRNLQLQHICREGRKLDPILEVLEELYMQECANMKVLVPSTASFSHLKALEITKCNGLINLIYSSTATSLVNLQDIKLKECKSLEEIVTQVMDEERDEIVFRSMGTLTLECLPRLNNFSSSHCLFRFPVLKKAVMRQCPRMKTFSAGATSTPMLRKVILKEGKDEEWCWDGDLNRTTKKLYVDKVAFSDFKYLELSEYPELKELWYGPVGQKILCNLKHLVVRKCTFLSNVLFSSDLLYTLEELEVAECNSIEVVFDVKALDDKAIIKSKKISGLKKLTLSELPNLKHIWNREAEEIISFGNLQIVKVDKCQHLKYLFSVSLCQDLRQLEELHIESCGIQEIVSIEGPEELKFNFPLLRSLVLWNLTQLTNFYPKRYTLECPSLETLNVRGCEEVQIFAFDDLNPRPLANIDLQMKQALFNIEKVSQNLEELPLNENDTMRVLNSNYDKNIFQNIKMLRMQQFQEAPIKFLDALIQIFPGTTTLQVRCSSFKTLFPSEEIVRCSIEMPNQIKTLWLFQLEQLENIWIDDDSASHPLIQNLEDLFIRECSRLIRLAPRSASFKSLTSLEVEDCNGLMYLMTSYTAKSLVHLTSLKVCNCGMLEVVVMMDEVESEEDITFESLKYLELAGLSGLKSFCYGKCTFIFPSLVILVVTRCHKMQSFSYGDIISPFLKSVEVENERKRWKEDLNTTIEQLFIDKAIGEGVEDDYKESSSITIQSSQIYQKIASTSRTLSSEKHGESSKAGTNTQKICEIIGTPQDQSNQNTSSLTTICAAHGTQDKTIERPLVQTTHQSTVSPSMVQDKGSNATGIGSQKICEIVEMPMDQASQNRVNLTKVDADVRNHLEMYKTSEKALVPAAQNVLRSSMVNNIAIDPSPSQALEGETSSIQDEAPQNQEMYENSVERPLVQSTETAPSTTTVYDADISQDLQFRPSENLLVQTTTSVTNDDRENNGTKEMRETIQRTLIPASIQGIATETLVTHESIDKPFVHDTQNAWDNTLIHDKEESHDSDIHPSKTLFDHTTTSMATDNKENVETEETYESKRSFSSHDAQNVVNPTMDYNTETNEAIEKSLSQTTQEAQSHPTSREIAPGSLQTHDTIQTDQDTESLPSTQNTEGSFDSSIGIQEICDTIKKPSISAAQNVPNSSMIANEAVVTQRTYESKRMFSVHNAQNILIPTPTTLYNKANDPSPSQASKAACTSITSVVDLHSSSKELDISPQLLPYLEVGVKRHPQVLNWLNTKQRRGLTSCSFSLFAEVTCIMRTTRRGELSEDDRNYIRKCLTVLEVVAFDASWLSYVYKCIEECGDVEDVKSKVEETKCQASNLEAQIESMKKELTSVKQSLVLLLGKASRLDDFIES